MQTKIRMGVPISRNPPRRSKNFDIKFHKRQSELSNSRNDSQNFGEDFELPKLVHHLGKPPISTKVHTPFSLVF